jgi:hypothetical protein
MKWYGMVCNGIGMKWYAMVYIAMQWYLLCIGMQWYWYEMICNGIGMQ